MAQAAIFDQEQRKIEVSRDKLIEALESNREKHIKDYEEAMAGYKETLLKKIDEAFDAARTDLEARHAKIQKRVSELTDAEISKQSDRLTLIDLVQVEMKVPRSFAKDYDAAIDMAKWDVRDTLELTHAEFTCFVRDQWDWKSGFDSVSAMYKKSAF